MDKKKSLGARNSKQLNILCIGQKKSGKTLFLTRFTRARQLQDYYKNIYNIFAKKINGYIVYFHEVSQMYEVYLQPKYDGVLFFIDLVDNWRVTHQIIQWMDLHADSSQRDVYNIPFSVIVMRAYGYEKVQKWKQKLIKQLDSIVNEDQILFWDSMQISRKFMSQFCDDIAQKRVQGIKRSFKTQLKFYGLEEALKYYLSYWEYKLLVKQKQEQDNQNMTEMSQRQHYQDAIMMQDQEKHDENDKQQEEKLQVVKDELVNEQNNEKQKKE